MAQARPVIAIVGGGFSGAMVAVQLLKRKLNASIVVFDATGTFGKGLAYGTDCESHLLNVPAGAMSAYPDDSEHFLRWLRVKDPSHTTNDFVTRKCYGDYLADIFAKAVAAANPQSIRTETSRVVDLTSDRQSGGFVCELENGQRLAVDAVVLALGNFAPAKEDLGQQRFNPWDPKSLAGIEKLDSLLVVGSGLTAVDVLLDAETRGFKGEMHLLSRRGLLPQVHTVGLPKLPLRKLPDLSLPLRKRIALIRQQVEEATKEGGNWRVVMDAMRPVVQELWLSLADNDRRRFLEHLRPYWDVHRHRLAPELGQKLDRWKTEGRLTVHVGRLLNLTLDAEKTRVSWRPRGTQQTKEFFVERIIHATGPESDLRKSKDALIRNLLDRGIVSVDTRGLGFNTTSNGEILNIHGLVQAGIFTLGPLRKGQLWESIAVREVRVQAQEVAQQISDRLSQRTGLEVGAAV